VECIWIGKQKVVLFPKFKKNQRETTLNALNSLPMNLGWFVHEVADMIYNKCQIWASER
jgi:hypothetical protein